MNWLEVSLTVDGELAESVADVLARFAPNGVMTEQGVDFLNEEDEGTASGPITVRAYLEADAQLEDKRQQLEHSLFYLGMIRPLPAAVYKDVADQNWMEAWKQHYQPILIGKRLLILPAWLESPDAARLAIKIEPGMAFGTGTHPTTQLCLELMEDYFGRNQRTAGDTSSAMATGRSSVIDIGCGSGILSIAAVKLGASKVLGVDIDADSIKNARHNADLNQIGAELLLEAGSVSEVQRGLFPIHIAPLVVANILAPVIIRLFEDGLAELVEAHGELILSGILDHQADDVLAAARAHGMHRRDSRQLNDWIALSLKR